MPTVTYAGKWATRPNRDVYSPEWRRGETVEVTQAWLDEWRHSLKGDFLVVGDEAPHLDGGNDGIPDSAWRKAEIMAWLDNNGIAIGGGYKTKSHLLSVVEEAFSPAPVEEPVVEAEPEAVEVVEEVIEAVEEVVEDAISEEE